MKIYATYLPHINYLNEVAMKQSFLEYFKYILTRVSFDKSLFAAEYRKALQYLEKDEVPQLEKWLTTKGYRLTSKR